jgi:hypothetical protein
MDLRSNDLFMPGSPVLKVSEKLDAERSLAGERHEPSTLA